MISDPDKHMTFQDRFLQRLQQLPEREIQEFPKKVFPARYRSAAVLLPFWPAGDGRVMVALTLRSDTLPTHRGQVSFPGGSVHDEDFSSEHTALRETREELGIPPEQITVMGRLDDAWSGYGYHIVPYVGWLDSAPELHPDPAEVAGILTVDVEMLMLPGSSRIHRIDKPGITRTTHAFSWDEGYVWGLTADILLELFLWVRGEASNRRDLRLDYMKKQMQQGGM